MASCIVCLRLLAPDVRSVCLRACVVQQCRETVLRNQAVSLSEVLELLAGQCRRDSVVRSILTLIHVAVAVALRACARSMRPWL